MALKHNWRDVLLYAWSIRFIVLAGLLSAVEFILPIFMDNPPLPRGLFALLAFVVSIGAFVARLIAQKKI
jgi:hypothetical protein